MKWDVYCTVYRVSIFLTTDPQVQKQVLDGLQKGNDALEKANAVFSLDEIESIMSDTEDAVEKQREIERMLSGGLTEVRKAMIIFLFLSDPGPIIVYPCQ